MSRLLHTATAALMLAATARGIRIVQTNVQGWAELKARSFNDALKAAGHDVVLSAPAESMGGYLGADYDPRDRKKPCEWNSCPAGSGSTGLNESEPDLLWVNAPALTAMRYGISTFGPQLWEGEPPDLAVAGIQAGPVMNMGIAASGNAHACAYATDVHGIPCIVFAGRNKERRAWDDPHESKDTAIFTEKAMALVQHLIETGKPYLPHATMLVVNFPAVDDWCTAAENMSYVMTRVSHGRTLGDLEFCGVYRMPMDTIVEDFMDVKPGERHCWISVSPVDATDLTTISDETRQKIIKDKLQPLLTCARAGIWEHPGLDELLRHY